MLRISGAHSLGNISMSEKKPQSEKNTDSCEQ